MNGPIQADPSLEQRAPASMMRMGRLTCLQALVSKVKTAETADVGLRCPLFSGSVTNTSQPGTESFCFGDLLVVERQQLDH